jgi:hypothetical protein
MPLTRSGAVAAAMVAAPPDRECPTMTAGPPRKLLTIAIRLSSIAYAGYSPHRS